MWRIFPNTTFFIKESGGTLKNVGILHNQLEVQPWHPMPISAEVSGSLILKGDAAGNPDERACKLANRVARSSSNFNNTTQ